MYFLCNALKVKGKKLGLKIGDQNKNKNMGRGGLPEKNLKSE